MDRRSEDVKRLQPDHGPGLFNKGAVLILEPDEARMVHHALRLAAWRRRSIRQNDDRVWKEDEYAKWVAAEERLLELGEEILRQQGDACVYPERRTAIAIEIERIEARTTGSKEEQAGALGALEWVQGGCGGEIGV